MNETKQSETPKSDKLSTFLVEQFPATLGNLQLHQYLTEFGELEKENQRLRDALEKLRDGDFAGTPINAGCAAMMLIEEALNT